MERCWDKNTGVRPHISEVVSEMTKLIEWFPAAEDDPLILPDGEVLKYKFRTDNFILHFRRFGVLP